MALMVTVRATAVRRAVGTERAGTPKAVTPEELGDGWDLRRSKWEV